MKPLALSILAGFAGSVLAQQYGDSPHLWSQAAEIRHGVGGSSDELMRSLTCVLEEPITNGKSFQCREDFVWVGPTATAPTVHTGIEVVQVEGYVQEARTLTTVIETRGAGRVDRGVILSTHCVGNVGSCVAELGHGWELNARPGSLRLFNPQGRLVDAWPK